MTTELMPVWEVERWNKAVERCGLFDIYHLAQYHLIANESGTPYLLAGDEGFSFAIPFVKKGSRAYSVYGYPGPLAKVGRLLVNPSLVNMKLIECFDELGINHAELRLHPIINFENPIVELTKIRQAGTTVAIDLVKPRSEQQHEVSKGHKADIKKASRLSVECDFDFKHLDRFIEAYQQTMDRANAASHYYFTPAYFYRLVAILSSEHLLLINAWDKDEIVSSALFFWVGDFAQYHLSATPDEHVTAGGAKAIINRHISAARALGYSWLHLGGGLGGDEDDPLFRFKAGFSKTRLPFQIATWEKGK